MGAPLSVADMGMITGLEVVAGGAVAIRVRPTTQMCTMVACIMQAIEDRVVRPGDVIVSRKAADQLRDRVSARLGRTTSAQMSSTFHSFAYALVRRYAPAELYEAPLRLLSGRAHGVVTPVEVHLVMTDQRLYRDDHVAAWRRITDMVHQWSPAKICLQLGHSGAKGSTRRMWEGNEEPLERDNWSHVPHQPRNGQGKIRAFTLHEGRLLEDA